MNDVTHFDVGRFGENQCVKYIKKVKKYRVLAKNATIGKLEMDVIAYDKDYVIFIEVKTRRDDKVNFHRPGDAVNSTKRSNLIKFVHGYMKMLPERHKNKIPRIDVCEITAVYEKKLKVNSLNYIENAVTK